MRRMRREPAGWGDRLNQAGRCPGCGADVDADAAYCKSLRAESVICGSFGPGFRPSRMLRLTGRLHASEATVAWF